jgi:anaerobic selenocysteine-containing dehydrogenase
MFKKKNAQGLSVTTIVVAVIGLIILVVVISMLTGKLGNFGSGLSTVSGCDNICKGAGYNGQDSSSAVTPGLRDANGNPCKCK